MKQLQCLIADDEPIARQILEGYISDIPYLTLVGSCKNAFEVLEVIQEETIDLLFLDINMPKLSGLSLLKTMQQKPKVVITTAYAEYAVDGFELNVSDYLLKPFSLERFLQAVVKIQNQFNTASENSSEISQEEKSKSIFVKSDKKILKLNYEDIGYVEAYGNYIKIHTNSMILTPQTLSDFSAKLPEHFLRIHKSHVINLNHLKLIDGNQVILDNEVKLIIGKSYRKNVLDYIEKNSS